MNFTVSKNGQPVAQFVNRGDAEEFLSNLQYEDGHGLYELNPS
jgi:hypothetical protein